MDKIKFILKFNDFFSYQTDDGKIIPRQIYTEEINLLQRPFLRMPVSSEIATQWGGKDYLVQVQTWNLYEIELHANESQIVALSQIKYCNSATIEDTIGNVLHTIIPQYFQMEEPEQLGASQHLRIRAKFRVFENSLIIDRLKTPSPTATELYIFSNRILDNYFLSASIYSNLPILTDNETTAENSTQIEGITYAERLVNYSVKQFRTYLSETDKNHIAKYMPACRVAIGNNIDRIAGGIFYSCENGFAYFSEDTPNVFVAGTKIETTQLQILTATGPGTIVEANGNLKVPVSNIQFTENTTGYYRIITNTNYEVSAGNIIPDIKETGGPDLWQLTVNVQTLSSKKVFEIHK